MKKAHQSKTVRVNALAALALFFPHSEAWVSAHPRASVLGLICANCILRLVSHDKLALDYPLLKKFIVSTLCLLSFFSCAMPETRSALLGLEFEAQPPRAAIRAACNGEEFATQGVVVCEQKAPSVAQVSVKVPPLEGRVIYSNGQLKGTDDFNWYPEEGFFIWKKKELKDNWIPLDLGEINATYGDWPVALDIMAVASDGLVNTRGILYHRVCDDLSVPCSQLVVEYECAGVMKKTGPGVLGKCVRMASSPQGLSVALAGPTYALKPGAKVYVSAPRLGVLKSLPITLEDLQRGSKKVELPSLPSGPTLIGLRAEWFEGLSRKSVETRILVVASDPKWTGLDQPHIRDRGDTIDVTKPVLSDLMEVDLYEGNEVKKKSFGGGKVIHFQKPHGAQKVCAFSWQRDSSDLSITCIDEKLSEVAFP